MFGNYGNFLSTPEGYATQDQIGSANTLGQNLLKGGQRDDTITSPWQGVRMMADTLAGGNALQKAGGAQMNLNTRAAQDVTQHAPANSPMPPQPGTPPQMQPPPAQPAPISMGPPPTPMGQLPTPPKPPMAPPNFAGPAPNQAGGQGGNTMVNGLFGANPYAMV
jgi:hypothetical protein